MGRPASDAKDRILCAAAQIALENGAAKLTMDAVAAKSGMSKGGVLHHFHTKEELIEGLIDCGYEQLDQALTSLMAADKGHEAGRFLRAWIRCAERQQVDPLFQVFVPVVFADKRLLTRVTSKYEAWYRRGMEDGIDIADALIIMNTVDSAFTMGNLFGMRMPKGLEQKMLVKLMQMANGQYEPEAVEPISAASRAWTAGASE
jgi:AcrR family transcriptional regulator